MSQLHRELSPRERRLIDQDGDANLEAEAAIFGAAAYMASNASDHSLVGSTPHDPHPRQAAVSSMIDTNVRERPWSGRMKMLSASSGSVATFSQNACQTPLRRR